MCSVVCFVVCSVVCFVVCSVVCFVVCSVVCFVVCSVVFSLLCSVDVLDGVLRISYNLLLGVMIKVVILTISTNACFSLS